MRRLLIILTASVAVAQSQGGPQGSTFEGKPAVTLSNDRLQMTVMVQGSSIASLVMTDDAQELSPYWNPTRLAREVGRTVQFTGSLGHFVCVDGVGPASAGARARNPASVRSPSQRNYQSCRKSSHALSAWWTAKT